MLKIDGNQFRRARMQAFLQRMVKPLDQHRPIKILDVGGTLTYWRALHDLWSPYPLDITVINLDCAPVDDGPLHERSGNACSLDQFDDNAFHISHSNSVIEHVGRWPEMTAMADELQRVAERFYLQTPNFWFPVEPHYRSFLFHFFPEAVRARKLMRRRYGFRGPYSNLDSAMRDVQSVSLLDRRQLEALYPGALVRPERFFGLAKSLIVEG